jgi:hypothetical protein
MRLRKPDTQQFAQAASCIVCFFVTLQVTDGLEGTEFGGGWLTGPLLTFADIGTLLFLLALVATFVFPRIAAATGLAASLLSSPLYLYFLAPAAFSRIFAPSHQNKIEPTPGLRWGRWTVTGLLMLLMTAYLCICRIARKRNADVPLKA